MDKKIKVAPEVVETPEELAQDSMLAGGLERTATMKKKPQVFAIGVVAVVLLGLGTGYVAAAMGKGPTVVPLETSTTDAAGKKTTTAVVPEVKPGQVFGSKDAGAFKDSVEGVVLPGGIGSEGSHHLVRPGGASQNVYLTSSILDLKMFENAKVKVFGETFKAQKAGWLMDVGRVEVEELNAPLPDWAAQTQKTAAPAAGGEQ